MKGHPQRRYFNFLFIWAVLFAFRLRFMLTVALSRYVAVRIIALVWASSHRLLCSILAPLVGTRKFSNESAENLLVPLRED